MNRSLHGRTEPSPADTIYFTQTKIITRTDQMDFTDLVNLCFE